MGDFSKDRLLYYIERRYDYYSARTLLAEALKTASVAEKDAFSQAEIEQLCDALKGAGTNQAEMLTKIRVWAGLQEPEPEPEAEAEAPAEAEAAPADDDAKKKAEEEAKKKAEEEAKKKDDDGGKKGKKGDAPTETVITISAKGAPDGGKLVLTGDGKPLGDWDPKKAVALEAGKKGVFGGTFTAKPGDKFTCKLVLVPDKGDPVWEGGDNRPVEVPAEAEWTLELEWVTPDEGKK